LPGKFFFATPRLTAPLSEIGAAAEVGLISGILGEGIINGEFQVFWEYSQVPWLMQMVLIYLRHRVTKNGFSQG